MKEYSNTFLHACFIDVLNTALTDAITLALAWCDKMLFLYTLFLTTERDDAFIYNVEHNDSWEHPDGFQELRTSMPPTWRPAWSRVRALLAPFAGAPIR